MNIYTEWKKVNLATPEQAEKIAITVRYGASVNSLQMDELIRNIAASTAYLTKGNIVHISEEMSERSLCMDYGANAIGRFVSSMSPMEFLTNPSMEVGGIDARIVVIADYLYDEDVASAFSKLDLDCIVIEPYGDYLADALDIIPDDIKSKFEQNPSEKIRNNAAKVDCRILFWDKFLEIGKDKPLSEDMLSQVRDDRMALMGRSGGSTGIPKGIKHTIDGYFAKLRMIQSPDSPFNFQHDNIVLVDLGPRYITGRTWQALFPLNMGCGIAIDQFSSITDMYGSLEWSKASIVTASTTQLRHFEKAQLATGSQFAHVKHVLGAGERFSGTDFKELRVVCQRAGIRSFWLGFGAGEYLPATMTGTETSGEWYTPIPEVEILLMDEVGNIINGDGVGIALIHSPALMVGYLDEEKNDEFFFEINEKLYGNNDDIFMMKTDSGGKKWFKPLGRKNRLTYFVDNEGKAVYGLLVDDFLADSEHTKQYIHRAQVVVPDDNSQTLVAHIELKAEYRDKEESTIKKIAQACAENLDESLMPSEFEVWEIMPHSSSRGKIDLEALSAKSKRKLNNIYTF